MYAIALDLDMSALERQHPDDSWKIALHEIHRVLTGEGFYGMRGSSEYFSGMYYGSEHINAVECVRVAQKLASELWWFTTCVCSIHMLRIEDKDDLGPAIGLTLSPARRLPEHL